MEKIKSKAKLKDEQVEKVNGGILKIQSDDYLANFEPGDEYYTDVYYNNLSDYERQFLDRNVCPRCCGIAKWNGLEGSCDTCYINYWG